MTLQQNELKSKKKTLKLIIDKIDKEISVGLIQMEIHDDILKLS